MHICQLHLIFLRSFPSSIPPLPHNKGLHQFSCPIAKSSWWILQYHFAVLSSILICQSMSSKVHLESQSSSAQTPITQRFILLPTLSRPCVVLLLLISSLAPGHLLPLVQPTGRSLWLPVHTNLSLHSWASAQCSLFCREFFSSSLIDKLLLTL